MYCHTSTEILTMCGMRVTIAQVRESTIVGVIHSEIDETVMYLHQWFLDGKSITKDSDFDLIAIKHE